MYKGYTTEELKRLYDRVCTNAPLSFVRKEILKELLKRA